jgi:hypothetical protein
MGDLWRGTWHRLVVHQIEAYDRLRQGDPDIGYHTPGRLRRVIGEASVPAVGSVPGVERARCAREKVDAGRLARKERAHRDAGRGSRQVAAEAERRALARIRMFVGDRREWG